MMPPPVSIQCGARCYLCHHEANFIIKLDAYFLEVFLIMAFFVVDFLMEDVFLVEVVFLVEALPVEVPEVLADVKPSPQLALQRWRLPASRHWWRPS